MGANYGNIDGRADDYDRPGDREWSGRCVKNDEV